MNKRVILFLNLIGKIFNPATLAVFLFFVCLVAYFHLAFQHLDEFDTADEHLWILGPSLLFKKWPDEFAGRIEKYWLAMGDQEWEKTRINDKPGVSLAYVSGLSYLFGEKIDSPLIDRGDSWVKYKPESSRKMFLAYRWPLVVFTGLMGIFFFVWFWRLLGDKWFALVTAASLLFSPILVGISQIVNPDTLLWPFSFASILAFFVFLCHGRFFDALLAAVFFGFALLSKYVALILIPFYLVIGAAVLFFGHEKLERKGIFARRSAQFFSGYLFVVATGVGLFALLMPALLVKEGLLYDSILGFGSLGKNLIFLPYLAAFFLIDALFFQAFVLFLILKLLYFARFLLPRLLYLSLAIVFFLLFSNLAFGQNFLEVTEVSFGSYKELGDFFTHSIASQVNPLVFSLPPVVLFFVLFFWLKSVVRRGEFDYIAFPLSLFIVVYYWAMYVQKVTLNPRYSILLYPIVTTLAGLGVVEFARLWRIDKKNWLMAILVLLMIGGSAVSLWKSRPFYFNYATDLLPKEYSLSKGWGYGGYEAAQFVNRQLGNRENLVVWSDYEGFCPFFQGECLFQNSPRWMKKNQLAKIEYYVTSAQGQRKNRQSTKVLEENMDGELVWELLIDGRPDNFVRVYKNNSFLAE